MSDAAPAPMLRRYSQANSYVGADLSPEYVASARQRYPAHQFEVWDITRARSESGEPFDVALINSVFHHLSDEETETRSLTGLPGFLRPGIAEIHIIDLVLPPDRSLARTLAKLDRGIIPRPIEHWRSSWRLDRCHDLRTDSRIGLFGRRMWEMVYVQGSCSVLAETSSLTRRHRDSPDDVPRR